MITQKIAICLWFEDQAEEASKFYTSIFKNSKISTISKFTEAGQENHHRKPGSVMAVTFEINGQPFMALNGSPGFKFNDSFSLQVFCETQEEIDYFWYNLSEGGKEVQCGWLLDKFGFSWQIIPTVLEELQKVNAEKVNNALMKMKKLDIEQLRAALN